MLLADFQTDLISAAGLSSVANSLNLKRLNSSRSAFVAKRCITVLSAKAVEKVSENGCGTVETIILFSNDILVKYNSQQLVTRTSERGNSLGLSAATWFVRRYAKMVVIARKSKASLTGTYVSGTHVAKV